VDQSLACRRHSQSAVTGLRWSYPPGTLRHVPGLLLCAGIAAIASRLGAGQWLQAHGMSALTMAILLGIVLGNTLYPRLALTHAAGVELAKKTVLRLGVILYGLRLTLHDVLQVGVAGVLTDALLLTSTFALALLLGTRYFGLDRRTAALIGAGSGICGAAAVMATESLLRSKAEQVTVAISTVVVFGTLAIFVYPALYHLNLHWHVLPPGSKAFGIYAGSTIHEVAQVFAAGQSISPAIADTAVITKMVRVMMLAPFLLALSGYLTFGRRQPESSEEAGRTRLSIPWFAFVFIGMVLFNSLDLLPHAVVKTAIDTDTFLLATAMAALGLTTHLAALRRAGIKPLLLGATLFIWLVVGGAAINAAVVRMDRVPCFDAAHRGAVNCASWYDR
jgi:uncharacterized integral membrane protein (TIGR00698 family)